VYRAQAARPKPPPPAARHKIALGAKSLTSAIQKPVLRFVVAATPPKPSNSNGLLFVGGLALLVLVLGDAAFLALSARVLREPTR
jgi:hypothetical protein